MQNFIRTLVVAPIFMLAACQTMPYQPYAREVKKKPMDSGMIALKAEHRDEDRAKAQTMMQSNCGSSGVKIVEEGEVVVGSSTVSNAQETRQAGTKPTSMGTLFGMPVTSGGNDPSNNTATSATTTSVKEWNISYECEKADVKTVAPKKAK